MRPLRNDEVRRYRRLIELIPEIATGILNVVQINRRGASDKTALNEFVQFARRKVLHLVVDQQPGALKGAGRQIVGRPSTLDADPYLVPNLTETASSVVQPYDRIVVKHAVFPQFIDDVRRKNLHFVLDQDANMIEVVRRRVLNGPSWKFAILGKRDFKAIRSGQSGRVAPVVFVDDFDFILLLEFIRRRAPRRFVRRSVTRINVVKREGIAVGASRIGHGRSLGTGKTLRARYRGRYDRRFIIASKRIDVNRVPKTETSVSPPCGKIYKDRRTPYIVKFDTIVILETIVISYFNKIRKFPEIRRNRVGFYCRRRINE